MAALGGAAATAMAAHHYLRRQRESTNAPSDDVDEFADPKFRNNIILTATERLSMNRDNQNVLVLGYAGSGKTESVIKPNLLQCSSDYPCSFVVADPYGDILKSIGYTLELKGYTIKILNLLEFNRNNSMPYNPFAYIHGERDILKLTDLLIQNTPDDYDEKEREFNLKMERFLLVALIGYLYYEAPEDEKNLYSLAEGLFKMDAVEDLLEKLEKKNPQHFAIQHYRAYKHLPALAASKIRLTAARRLICLGMDDEMEYMTGKDALDIGSLLDEKTALFVIGSGNRTSGGFLGSICISQAFDELFRKLDSVEYDEYGDEKQRNRVRFLIDDAASINVLNLEKIVALSPARGISVMLSYQFLSQIKAQYEDAVGTIIGNMGSILLLGRSHSKELGALMGCTIPWVTRSSGCVLKVRGFPLFFSERYDIQKHPDYHDYFKFDIADHIHYWSRLNVAYNYEDEDEDDEPYENEKELIEFDDMKR